jgi:hypothetical protein
LAMTSILVFLHIESVDHRIRIQAQRPLLCLNFFRKRFRCLDVTVML